MKTLDDSLHLRALTELGEERVADPLRFSRGLRDIRAQFHSEEQGGVMQEEKTHEPVLEEPFSEEPSPEGTLSQPG